MSPGDLVVGDEDGVAVAPKERRDEVAALALKLRREKEELLPLITRFRSYTDALAEQRRRAGSRP